MNENYNKIDELLRKASEKENLGNKYNWFFVFRNALYAFYNRIGAVHYHYDLMHRWIPMERNPNEDEYHLTSILFNMDSAIECLIFALNSFGQVVDSKNFYLINLDNELRNISPKNIIQEFNYLNKKNNIYIGYNKLFNELQKYWLSKKELHDIIIDNHDVSKHRHSIYGSSLRDIAAPDGFYEILGVKGNIDEEYKYWPVKEVYLHIKPKQALIFEGEADSTTLEKIVPEFFEFIEISSTKLLNDLNLYFLDNPLTKK